MQFSIVREHLIKALKAVSGVVERRQAQSPILSNALFTVVNETLVVTATDQEVELTFSVPTENVKSAGSVLLPFKKISDICRALPDQSILEVKVTSARASIVAGKSRFSLTTLSADKFPKIEPPQGAVDITIARKSLLELVERTSFAMAEQDVRYFLNGMLFEWKDNNLKAVAADGHRLVVHNILLKNGDLSPQNIIVPRKGVLEISRALHEGPENISFIVSKTHLRLVCGAFELVSTLFEGKFPDYEQVIPEGGDKVVIGNRDSLKEAFQRTAALLSDRVRGINLRLGSGCVKIFANNAENDEAEEELDVSYKGEELDIGFNVSYLVEFLTVATAKKIRLTFSDANNSALLEEELEEGVKEQKGLYIIMPMRV